MPRVRQDLTEVDSDTGECAKRNCCTSSRTLHRHHRKHEAMWLGIWSTRRWNEDKFLSFGLRYNEFHPDDWVRICADHHAEIHLIYDQIIRKDKKATGRPLSKYSWVQAEKLMAKLEAACIAWLKKETPGLSSTQLNTIRDRRYSRSLRDFNG